MYKISEFSRITGLTVKTLRYYDEQGILKASCRAENAYRFYDDADFQKARLVILLRDLAFSIAEMKEILAQGDSPDDLAYYLAEKRALIAEQIRKDRELLKKFDLYLQPQATGESKMTYQITRKDFAALTVASVRFQGKYGDVGKYFGLLLKETGRQACGPPFCCYYDDDYREEADIEACVPTRGAVHGKWVKARELPGITAVCTTHTGNYASLNLAYKAVLDYTGEQGLQCLLPSREIYHQGPGLIFRGNPHKYVTEIVIPVQPEA
jgi:DNA-binding transcriptional MerR regulator